MRNRLVLATAALLLSSPIAMAQTPQPQQASQAPAQAVPTLGSIDFGFRGTDTDGDEARYERYRDLRSGAYSKFVFGKETDSYFFTADAYNVGYRDQRYALDYGRNKLKFNFFWDSTPTNFSYLSITPYSVSDNGVLTISPTLRQQVQGPTNGTTDGVVGVPCAPGGPPATCNATTAPAALANRSIYNTALDRFDLQLRRDTAAFGFVFDATKNLGVDVKFASTGRTGHQPWGASFAFNDAIELPLPLDQRTNDMSAALEWANPKGMVRVGWNGSYFDNDVQTLVWDNPIRATDFNNGLLPPGGPYDPSGYSNGNGPAQGRMALMPSNSMNVVSATGLYKMPMRSAVNGTLQFTNQSQDEALIPWTINNLINSTPAVLATFPHLQQLPRNTAQAEVQALNALVNFTSRPIRNFGVQARYRYNKRDNETPQFDATEYVRFDAVPEEIEEGFSHQYDVTRQNFDANGTLSLLGYGSLRFGYGHEAYERHGRGFSDTGENIFRLSYDTYTFSLFSVRAGFEYGRRRGEGFVEQGVDYELGPGGTQPGLRYFDEADRNRTRGTLLLSIDPTDMVNFYVSYSGGKDEYLADESVPPGREFFGLLDSSVNSVNAGVNVSPSSAVMFGINYGRESYSALQKSRNANPPPDASWTDPNRNWTLDNDEKIDQFTLSLDLLRAIRNTDIRLSYDLMDSNNAFVHGGPRVATLQQAGQFIALPDVDTTWNRFAADVRYFFTPVVGIGVAYWYEKLDVLDFATVDSNGSVGFTAETGQPRLDYLGGLITGYNPRDYTGNTAFVRLLYLF